MLQFNQLIEQHFRGIQANAAAQVARRRNCALTANIRHA